MTGANHTQTASRIDLGLCPIDMLSMRSAAVQISALAKSKAFHYVVTPNIDHLQRLHRASDGDDLLRIYRHASLSLCDSSVLAKLLYLKGIYIQDIVPGSSLTQKLFDDFIDADSRVFIVGGEKETIRKLKYLYPYLSISHVNPSMGFIRKDREVDGLIKRIKQANPDYIFLAVGSPQQEILAAKLAQKLTRGVALCVGASLLFLSGQERRAPDWLQALTCEWLYRLIHNPRRLAKRYFLNIMYLPGIYSSIQGNDASRCAEVRRLS